MDSMDELNTTVNKLLNLLTFLNVGPESVADLQLLDFILVEKIKQSLAEFCQRGIEAKSEVTIDVQEEQQVDEDDIYTAVVKTEPFDMDVRGEDEFPETVSSISPIPEAPLMGADKDHDELLPSSFPAFRPMASLAGFPSTIQTRQGARAKYMESDSVPNASLKGRGNLLQDILLSFTSVDGDCGSSETRQDPVQNSLQNELATSRPVREAKLMAGLRIQEFTSPPKLMVDASQRLASASRRVPGQRFKKLKSVSCHRCKVTYLSKAKLATHQCAKIKRKKLVKSRVVKKGSVRNVLQQKIHKLQ